MKARLLALILMLFGACGAAKSDLPPIKVTLYPRIVVSAPLQRLQVDVMIPRDKHNRSYCMVVEGPVFYYSSTCKSLDGDKEPAIFNTWLVNLDEEGEYRVTAYLYTDATGPNKAAAISSDTLQVGATVASIADN